MGVYLFAGKTADAKLPHMASRFRNPLLVTFMPCDRRKFSGGRTAVQDNALEELFYRPDPYADVAMQSNQSWSAGIVSTIQITGIKESRGRKGVGAPFLPVWRCR